ncbi:hypothetical protein NDU88_001439 [Pleurodeles waltl]|uniref:Uncharacterized protein n=1 Tax=Pleurodeles waltl TaxID=8319 RepID=A0AAV7S9X2_PLEWA|nr:hypothetical protein NDU88_001439 [Pleurodeles waltl]
MQASCTIWWNVLVLEKLVTGIIGREAPWPPAHFALCPVEDGSRSGRLSSELRSRSTFSFKNILAPEVPSVTGTPPRLLGLALSIQRPVGPLRRWAGPVSRSGAWLWPQLRRTSFPHLRRNRAEFYDSTPTGAGKLTPSRCPKGWESLGRRRRGSPSPLCTDCALPAQPRPYERAG